MATLADLGPAPKLNTSFDTFVVVNNIPAVSQDRIERLRDVITKVMSGFGTVKELFLPQNEDLSTTGCCFVEFATVEEARKVVQEVNGYRLDKKHIFTVTSMNDFDSIVNTPDEFKFKETVLPEDNLQWWLTNPYCDDQYAYVRGRDPSSLELSVCWNKKRESVAFERREKWTESPSVAWSPQGSWMITFFRQGVVLWGGPTFSRTVRIPQANVKMVDFSPCERFLVTYSLVSDVREPAVVIWRIENGSFCRGFTLAEVTSKDTSISSTNWPVFKWSHDGNYFSRLTEEQITIFESSTMGVLGKKSIKIKGVKEIAWSPSDNYLAYWLPEEGERPTKVVILSIPDRTELKTQNLYSVKDCKMTWHNKGDYLGVKVERVSKKKVVTTNLTLFRVREKLIPCDVVELKDKVETFSWEPTGNKFVVVHGDNTFALTIYQMQANGPVALKRLERISANVISWSPRGQYFVASMIANKVAGTMAFIDAAEQQILKQREHHGLCLVDWDPTGRFVVSAVTSRQSGEDTGFNVYTFLGDILQKHTVEHLHTFVWRPRPASLLQPAQIEKIKKSLKSYQSEFEAQDVMQQSRATDDQKKKRRALLDTWAAYENSHAKISQERLATMCRLRRDLPPNGQPKMVEREESVEFLVKEDVTVVDRVD